MGLPPEPFVTSWLRADHNAASVFIRRLERLTMRVQLRRYQPASEETIRAAEQACGAIFTEDYKRFVRMYDGAIPEDCGLDGDDEIAVDQFLPVATLADHVARIEGFPNQAWPIAEDSGGNVLYMRAGDARVHFWHHEFDGDGRAVASSFGELLDRLVLVDPNTVKLDPKQVRSVWVDPNFIPKFDRSISWRTVVTPLPTPRAPRPPAPEFHCESRRGPSTV